MKTMFSMILLFLQFHSPSIAAPPQIEITENGGYKIEKRTDFGIISDDLQSRTPDKITYALYGPDGKKIMNLENIYFQTYRIIEVCKDEVMWPGSVPAKGPTEKENSVMWVYNTKTKLKDYFELSGSQIFLSPDCRKLVYSNHEYNLIYFDRDKKTSTQFTKIGDGGRKDGFTPVDWSSDGSKFWFGSGVAETYNRLGFYQDGKVTWTTFDNPSFESHLEPNKGWMAHSDWAFQFDAPGQEEYEKSGTMTSLKITDIVSGKEFTVSSGKVNKFSPVWNLSGKLTYRLKGKEKSISYSEIEKRLKTAKVPKVTDKEEKSPTED